MSEQFEVVLTLVAASASSSAAAIGLILWLFPSSRISGFTCGDGGDGGGGGGGVTNQLIWMDCLIHPEMGLPI